ncbi:hypothetical protein BK660_10150 [Pseudomonas brassicacearum]|uniref:Uncharacterized protein n=1 Tax=Pseudomonas brassicacearum TaxID=930166 RepID=A0A423I8W8_9PSED|nr:hypothetical protein [Pseudomonas brassicacearum]RON21928.1 hypothetical protein BK660_10150 [Pseudomonas brassicacearum]
MRKQIFYVAAAVILIATALIIYISRGPEQISFHIGKNYDDVVRDSTFPVERETAVYPSEPPHPSSTWISSPVIITFDDKQHGFTLPATKFGAIGWSEFKAITLSTSPMLETLPFEQAIELLGELQKTLKQAGWVPETAEGNDWLKTENQKDKALLQAKLFDQMDGVILLIPHKYSLILHIKCYARCDERNSETAKYLIDVGLGEDHFSD